MNFRSRKNFQELSCYVFSLPVCICFILSISIVLTLMPNPINLHSFSSLMSCDFTLSIFISLLGHDVELCTFTALFFLHFYKICPNKNSDNVENNYSNKLTICQVVLSTSTCINSSTFHKKSIR